MKAKVTLDKRSDFDKKWDKLWNELVRSAKLSAIQSTLVAAYLRKLMTMRIHEVESAVDMGWLLSLIEGEKFGTDVRHGATRLLRAQKKALEIRNDAYGKNCIDANGHIEYDGCGLDRLQIKLRRYDVEYDTNL